MLDLALCGRNGPVTVAHISARQKISPQYLEQLFARLRNHRLVESVRGPGGGFCLSRAADDISVAEIIRAVNEPIDATRCHGKLNCRDGKRCMTHELWDDLNGVISGYLASVNLAQLIARQAPRHAAVQPLKRAQRPSADSTAFTEDSKQS
jgi:Rrf2 family iron-sulfur cluster assembly transcriptional regulator